MYQPAPAGSGLAHWQICARALIIKSIKDRVWYYTAKRHSKIIHTAKHMFILASVASKC